MRRAEVLCFLVASSLAGCAGTNVGNQSMLANGSLSVQPSQGQSYDFVVSLRNVKDFGFDPDDKATRDRTALMVVKDQCPGGRVVGETVINTGTYLLGNPARTYAMQVKCT